MYKLRPLFVRHYSGLLIGTTLLCARERQMRLYSTEASLVVLMRYMSSP